MFRIPIVAWQVEVDEYEDGVMSAAKPVLINKYYEHATFTFHRPDKTVGIHDCSDDYEMSYGDWLKRERENHTKSVAAATARKMSKMSNVTAQYGNQ